MGYYWFNKKELLQKTKEKYDNGGKVKKRLCKKVKNRYKNLSE